ncbi:MAG: DEAD/DEAH box helicase [Christensenellales bacterium]|jgi:ATP-dependent RNA helicase DeaD
MTQTILQQPDSQAFWQELALSDPMQRAITDMGFAEPTPIQRQSIPVTLSGADVIGQAQTGTGKTAAFAIPILERIDPAVRQPQALVLCPTRELAVQTGRELLKLARYMPKVRAVALYGGEPIARQLRPLAEGAQVVVGTPGRVMDHMRRGTLKLDGLKIAVLDEADEMLDMGFREDMQTILDGTPDDRQTLLFSATMPAPILALSRRYLKDPRHIAIAKRQVTVAAIAQSYLRIRYDAKEEQLASLLEGYAPRLALIFCNTKRRVDELCAALKGRGFAAAALHGDMRQRERDTIMASFRHGLIKILVATDVAARGLDVDDVDLVVNFDPPQDPEYYVHRIGRTGRAGRAGRAVTFITSREMNLLQNIRRYTRAVILPERVPTGRDLERLAADRFKQRLEQARAAGAPERLRSLAAELLAEAEDPAELVAALLALQEKA